MNTATSSLIDLAEATIRDIAVSDMDNNVYLLTSKRTGQQLLIDAADDMNAIGAMLKEAQGDTDAESSLIYVATTHSHWDHVRALQQIVELTGATTVAGREDAPHIEVPTDVVVDHDDQLIVGDIVLDCIKLRGHTPGSVAFLYTDKNDKKHLFAFVNCSPTSWTRSSPAFPTTP
jgi:glyoxylase-like metal-dependent hydrolase (beta-lactamase superfamily II)